MNGLENFLIVVGISANIFAGMEWEGSLVARVDKKNLGAVCAVAAVWQMGALLLGSSLSGLFYGKDITGEEQFFGLVLAMVIFFFLGLRLLLKALKNENLHERREDRPQVKRYVSITAAAGIYTLLTGIACGFLETGLAAMLFMTAFLTVAAVISGTYAGYRLGFVHKTKAYLCGTVLLWAAGAEVFVRYIVKSG